jgi:hypothetical protein
MSEKKFHFIYVTTNLVNGKQYVGDHSTNNLDDGYLGSGRPIFEEAKNKYGKKNFKKEILEFFDTKEDAFNAQEKYIKKFNTLIPNGYNISPTGGLGVSGCFSKEWLIENGKKISKANKGRKLSKEHKQKISNSLSGKPKSKEHIKNLLNKNKGKKHTKEQNEEHSKKMSGSGNPNFGKKKSNEVIEKIRNSNINKKRSKETRDKQANAKKGKPGNNRNKMWITNGSKNKMINYNENIPENWKRGMTRNKLKAKQLLNEQKI